MDSQLLYGFEHIPERELNIDNILKQVKEITLWRYYLDFDFVLGKVISSPLRIDRNPSFNVFLGKKGFILFKDFSTGQFGNIFDFIGLKFNLSFAEVLIKINCDFDLGLGVADQRDISCISHRKMTKKKVLALRQFTDEMTKSTILYQVVPRSYSEDDIAYWNSYGITQEILKMYNVLSVYQIIEKRAELKIKSIVYNYLLHNPAYAYYFPVSKHFKFYWPLEKDRTKRFLGNVNNYEDIQGYYQCKVKEQYENKFLILTKSMKDCMTLRAFGIDAMSIHGEGQKFYEDFIRHIKKYYPVIVSLYDRDVTGMKGGKYLWKEHGIKPYFINKRHNCKDVSDMYKLHGREEVRRFLEEIRSNVFNSKNSIKS